MYRLSKTLIEVCGLKSHQARNLRGENRSIALPRNFHQRMYLLGAATSCIIFLPWKYQLVAALNLTPAEAFFWCSLLLVLSYLTVTCEAILAVKEW